MLETTDTTAQDFMAMVLRCLPHLTHAEQQRLLKDEDRVRDFLTGLVPERSTLELPVWMTLKLGHRESAAEYEALFSVAGSGFDVTPWATAMMKKIVVPDREDEIVVKLGKVTPRMLGFEKPVTRKVFYAAAKKRGYERLTGEMVLALREECAYVAGDWCYVAMPSVATKGETKKYPRGIFLLAASDGRRILRGYSGKLEEEIHPASPYVFVIP